MSQYYQFANAPTMLKFVNDARKLGWKLDRMTDGTLALSKTNYVALNVTKLKLDGPKLVHGFTRYGINECQSLLEMRKFNPPIE
jgi:hypothetical protein